MLSSLACAADTLFKDPLRKEGGIHAMVGTTCVLLDYTTSRAFAPNRRGGADGNDVVRTCGALLASP